MSIENIHYRLATAEDQPFIDDMNVVAGSDPDMHESDLPTLEEYYKQEPGCEMYAEGFGREGDLGLIALDGASQPLGAVWGRVYDRTADYKVMQPHPFEVAIAVREHARGQGIGRQLLDSFAMAAWLQGHDQVSLVVDIRNTARALYEAAGYEPLRGKRGREVRIGRWFRPEFTPMARTLDFGPPVLRAKTLYEDPELSFASIKLRGRNRTTINHVSTTAYSVVRGEGTMTVGGVVHELKPGVTVKVPQGTPYFDEGNVDMKAVSYPPFNIDDVEVVQG